jgi:hypothetical protein
MVVTERAGEMLTLILHASHSDEEDCIRLDLSTTAEGLRIGRELVGDEVVTFEGRKVLAMDPYTAETCARHVLDCEDGRFVLMGFETRWSPAE